MKTSIALAALVATSIGLGTALPAFAQDAAPVPAKTQRFIDHNGPNGGQNGPGRGAGILGLICSDNGAEALEIHFVRLSHNLDLTTEQQPLFDAFKTKALTTQTSFADTCAAARPDQAADAKPDLLERLKSGLRIDEARLTALNDVLPSFEAFYTSLTDAQKADLAPRRGMMHDDRGGPGRDGHGDRNGRPPAPGRS